MRQERHRTTTARNRTETIGQYLLAEPFRCMDHRNYQLSNDEQLKFEILKPILCVHDCMVDKISEAARSWNMSRIRSRDTKPEMAVRRLLHSIGYRFRVDDRTLPGRPDIVFSKRKAIIFVHGCFWHQHQGCIDCSRPGSNQAYWQPKLLRNVRRDQEKLRQLAEMGWRTLIIWECQTRDSGELVARCARFLGPVK
jgi:DNA mismatch endonuclease, patch repair protein